jgi:hypothetical protein
MRQWLNSERVVRRIIAGVIVLGAAVFLVGIGVEHATSASHSETVVPGGTTSSGPESGGHESGGTDADQGRATHPMSAGEQSTSTSRNEESVGIAGLTIPAEDPVIVALAVAVSLGVAGLLMFRRERSIVVVAAVVAAVFAIVDCAELAHQVSESRATVAILAATTKLVHISAALAACAVITRVIRTQSRKRTI